MGKLITPWSMEWTTSGEIQVLMLQSLKMLQLKAAHPLKKYFQFPAQWRSHARLEKISCTLQTSVVLMEGKSPNLLACTIFQQFYSACMNYWLNQTFSAASYNSFPCVAWNLWLIQTFWAVHCKVSFCTFLDLDIPFNDNLYWLPCARGVSTYIVDMWNSYTYFNFLVCTHGKW